MNFNYLWTADGWAGDRVQWDASGYPGRLETWSADGFVAAYFMTRPPGRRGYRFRRR